jgi:hypothetical protein
MKNPERIRIEEVKSIGLKERRGREKTDNIPQVKRKKKMQQ